MTTPTALNNVEHKDLCVITQPVAGTPDRVNRCLIHVNEIADLHKEFPILFYRDPASNQLQTHAILGLDKDENLFLDEEGWTSRYVPALLAKGPFSLTYHQHEGSDQPEAVICVDMQDTRVSTTEGQPVFLPFGGDAPYLSGVKKALQSIQVGAQYDNTLFTLMESMSLLEPVSIQIKLNDDMQISFNQYLTVSQEKLANLSGEQLAQLNQYGVLGLLYFSVSSLANFQRLIDLKSVSLQGL